MSYSFQSNPPPKKKFPLTEKEVLRTLIRAVEENDPALIKKLARRLRQPKTGAKDEDDEGNMSFLKPKKIRKVMEGYEGDLDELEEQERLLEKVTTNLMPDRRVEGPINDILDYLSPQSRRKLKAVLQTKRTHGNEPLSVTDFILLGALTVLDSRKESILRSSDPNDLPPGFNEIFWGKRTGPVTEGEKQRALRAKQRALKALVAVGENIKQQKDPNVYYNELFFIPSLFANELNDRQAEIDYDKVNRIYQTVKRQHAFDRPVGFTTFRRYYFQQMVERFPRLVMSNNYEFDVKTLASKYADWLEFLCNFLLSENPKNPWVNPVSDRRGERYPVYPKLKTTYMLKFLLQEFCSLVSTYTGKDDAKVFHKGLNALLLMKQRKLFPSYKSSLFKDSRKVFPISNSEVKKYIEDALKIVPGLPPYDDENDDYKARPEFTWKKKFLKDLFEIATVLTSFKEDGAGLEVSHPLNQFHEQSQFIGLFSSYLNLNLWVFAIKVVLFAFLGEDQWVTLFDICKSLGHERFVVQGERFIAAVQSWETGGFANMTMEMILFQKWKGCLKLFQVINDVSLKMKSIDLETHRDFYDLVEEKEKVFTRRYFDARVNQERIGQI